MPNYHLEVYQGVPADYISYEEMVTYVNANCSASGVVTSYDLLTTSGALVLYIDNRDSLKADIDYVNTLFTSVSGMSDAEIHLLVTTTSGDIIAQIPTDYITNSQLTSTSGYLVNFILGVSGTLQQQIQQDSLNYFLVDGSRALAGNFMPDMTGATGDVSIRDIGSSTAKFNHAWIHDLHLDAGSLYVNDKKVIEDVSDTIVVRTDPDQDLIVKTFGYGDTRVESENIVYLTGARGLQAGIPSTHTGKNMQFYNESNLGDIIFSADGINSEVQFLAYNVIDFIAESVEMWANLNVIGRINTEGGYQISGTAPTGKFLIGNGLIYGPGDLPSDLIRTNQLTTTSGDIIKYVNDRFTEGLVIQGIGDIDVVTQSGTIYVDGSDLIAEDGDIVDGGTLF